MCCLLYIALLRRCNGDGGKGVRSEKPLQASLQGRDQEQAGEKER